MSLASRVLIVDDDPSLNRTLGWLLQEHGYDTTSLESGDQLYVCGAADAVGLGSAGASTPCDSLGRRMTRALARHPPYDL